MQKVIYINNHGQPCKRHGKIVKENGVITFLPNDTTRKIIIPKENLRSIIEVDDKVIS